MNQRVHSILLISKSTAKISTKVISACVRVPEINTMDKFVKYIDSKGVSSGLKSMNP